MMRRMVFAFIFGLGFSGVSFADREITVTGSAEGSLSPNLVNISLDVWAKTKAAQSSQKIVSQLDQQVQKKIESFKMKKDDVQTEGYSIQPEYEYNQQSRQSVLVGYRVSHRQTLILRKTEEVGSFLDAIGSIKTSGESGVSISNLNWDSDGRDSAEVKLLGAAVKSTRVRAEEIAKAAGVKIKQVSKIQHGVGVVIPQPVPMMKMMAEAQSDVGAVVSPGQIKLRVDVTAQYEIN